MGSDQLEPRTNPNPSTNLKCLAGSRPLQPEPGPVPTLDLTQSPALLGELEVGSGGYAAAQRVWVAFPVDNPAAEEASVEQLIEVNAPKEVLVNAP